MFLRITPILLLFFSFSAVYADAPVAGASVQMGEPLRDALDRYAEAGLNIVSTTATITARLRVTRLPNAGDSLETQVQTLLAAHGLGIVLIDQNNAYVERTMATQPAKPDVVVEVTNPVIEEMVVTSHYRVRRNRSQTSTLDHQDLTTLPSLGRDTLRSLQALPGIASSGISARHQFRGGDVNEVLYRLDGIELLEPFHLPSVQALFSAINLNIIESADVYVAGFPVSMGSRLSGVVDLALIEPQEKLAGSVDINLITAAADAHGWVGDWSWLLSGRRSLVEKTLGLFETDYGDPRFQDEFARITHASADHTFVASLLNSRDRVTISDSGEAGQSSDDYQAAWLRWQQIHSPQLDSTWQLTNITIDKRRRGEVAIVANSIGNLMENRKFTTIEFSNDWNWQINDRWGMSSGWSIARQEGEFDATLNALYGAVARPIQMTPAVQRVTSVDRSGESTLIYISVTNDFSERLSVEAGVRYDGQDIDPVHVSELSARANINFQLTPRWAISVNFGRYTQQQQLYEIEVDDGKAELDEPQHSDQINIASIWAPSDATRLRLDVYYREISDPWSHFENLYNQWVLFPELQGDRFEISPSRANVKGAELTLSYETAHSFSWNVHYAYSEAEEKYLGSFRRRPWDQKHSFKAGVRWQNDSWRVGLNATYRSGWPTTPFINASDQLANSIYEDDLPRYFTLDAHISRIFSVPSGSLELYLDVVNLTNRNNTGGYDYTAANARDQQSLLPLTPILGISWQW